MNKSMTYSIEPSEDKTFITIKVVGDITRNSAMKQNIEAHALGKKLGINKYLLDARESRNNETVIDNYEFAYNDMAKPMFDASARVAIIVSEDDHSHDFVVTASMNAGYHVKLFYDFDSAKQFLFTEHA